MIQKIQTIQNTVNTSTHITKTPTQMSERSSELWVEQTSVDVTKRFVYVNRAC